jgi:hypothetical protein
MNYEVKICSLLSLIGIKTTISKDYYLKGAATSATTRQDQGMSLMFLPPRPAATRMTQNLYVRLTLAKPSNELFSNLGDEHHEQDPEQDAGHGLQAVGQGSRFVQDVRQHCD